jgi:FkbM family methyltransferase
MYNISVKHKLKDVLFFFQYPKKFWLPPAKIYLLVPNRHSLRTIYNTEKFCNFGLVLISKLVFNNSDDEFIDVGANIGDSSLILSNNSKYNPKGILIEPSIFFVAYLKLNTKKYKKYQIYNKFISIHADHDNLKYKLRHWGGTAFLAPSRFIKIPIKKQINLVELINERTKLIKIDTDGYDHLILKNTLGKLGSNRPIFYFEHFITKPEIISLAEKNFKEFKNIGYKWSIIFTNSGKVFYSGKNNMRLEKAISLKDVKIKHLDIVMFSEKKYLIAFIKLFQVNI